MAEKLDPKQVATFEEVLQHQSPVPELACTGLN